MKKVSFFVMILLMSITIVEAQILASSQDTSEGMPPVLEEVYSPLESGSYPKSDIMFNIATGPLTQFQSIPVISFETEKRFLNQMFEEGGSFVGIGPAFGYSFTRDEFFGETDVFHEFYAGMNITLHGLELVERLMGEDFEFGEYIDPYFTVTPGYVALADPDFFAGDYNTGVSFGARFFYKAIGLNLQFGKVDLLDNTFKIGLVFRKYAEQAYQNLPE